MSAGKLKVKYECVDGMHFFTSGDSLTKGLCAASTDLETAFNEVGIQCAYLLKENHGVNVPSVKPAQSFADFTASIH